MRKNRGYDQIKQLDPALCDIMDPELAGDYLKIMNKIKENQILKIHQNKIYQRSDDGRWQTRNPEISCKTYQGLLDKLYQFYFEKNITLTTLFDDWVAKREADLDIAYGTTSINRTDWGTFIANAPISEIPVEEIKPADLLGFYKSVTSGRKITRKRLNNIKAIINGIYDLAVEKGILEVNIARAVSTRTLKCKVVDNSAEVYTDAERLALLNYLETIDDPYARAIELMFCCDVRSGELRALKNMDWDREGRTLHICKQLIREKMKDGSTDYNVLVYYTKAQAAGGNRYFPLSDRAEKILQRIYNENPFGEYLLEVSGEPLRPYTIDKRLKRYCAAVGIRYRSCHKIRFWAVSSLIDAGMDKASVQHYSGHLDRRTTEHYDRRISEDSKNRAIIEKVCG